MSYPTRDWVKECVKKSCKNTFYVKPYRFHLRDLCDECTKKYQENDTRRDN